MTITVNAVNDRPVAVNDTYSLNEDTVLAVSAGNGVLPNDSDTDGNPLTAVKVTDPAHGTVILKSDGSFIYVPNSNFNGIDEFTYKASDGTTDSNIATVTITVDSINDQPVAVNDTYDVNEDTALKIAAKGVMTNDSDVDGETLTPVLVSGPAHGALSLNSDGSFTYSPNANFNGTDSFTYKVEDSKSESNIATVTLTVKPVNDPPVAANDTFKTPYFSPISGSVAGNDSGRRPVIGSVPQRSASQLGGVISGKHELNMDALFLRLGPSLNWEASKRLQFDLLGGLSLALARTEYHYRNRAIDGLAVNGVPFSVEPQSGTASDTEFRAGFYSALRANYRLTKRWDAQAEVRHIWQEPFVLSAPRGSAEIDMSNGFAVVFGVGCRF